MSTFKRGTGFRVGTDVAYRSQVSNVLTPGSRALAGWTFGEGIDDSIRALAMLREPVAHRIVFHVAHDVFDNWFNLIPTDSKAAHENFDQKLQQVLSDLKAKAELTKIGVFERGFGWALLAISYKDSGKSPAEPLQDASDIINVKAYAPTQISGWEEDKEKLNADGTVNRNLGKPRIFKIAQKGTVSTLDVHHSRCILFATRFTGQEEYDWQGMSALDPAWDSMVTLRRNSWAFSTAAYRLAVPFFDVTLTDAEDADINAFVASGVFDNMLGQKFFAHNDKRKLELLGAEGKVMDPQRFALPDLERVSLATKIPMAILRGAQAGALESGATDVKHYFLLISNCQMGYEDGVRELINRVVAVKKDAALTGDYKFNWLNPSTLSESEKVTIENTKMDIAQKRKEFFTRNEIRKWIDPTAADLSVEQGKDEIVGRSNPVSQAAGQGQPTNNSFVVQTNGDGSLTVTEVAKQPPASKQKH